MPTGNYKSTDGLLRRLREKELKYMGVDINVY